MSNSKIASNALRVGLHLIALLFAVAFTAPATFAADLSASDKATVAQLDSLLTRVDTNIKLAAAAAGPGEGPLAGTKARLTAVRLQPAKDAMPAILEKLKTLPADHADVIALQKRADTHSQAIAAIQNRIDGKAGSTPPADPSKQTMKLDYQQEESLKNARFVLREIEGQSGALEKVVADIKKVEDKNKIDHRLVAQAMNSVAFIKQRDKFMAGHMGKLPDNGTGVAQVSEAWKAAIASADASEKVLAPIHEHLAKLVDPASHPQFEADIKRLAGLTSQYANTEQFISNREQAGIIHQQKAAALEEVSRINTTYALLMVQKTDQGIRLEKQVAYFNEKLGEFEAAAAAQAKALPGEIRGHLIEVNRLADQAVKEEKPAFFGGGIAQVIDFAQEKQSLLAALAPEEAKATQAELEKTRAELKVKQKALSAAIIAANTLPPDRYTGEDRAKLIELATATWKKQQPDAVILAARIPSEKWSRSTRWEYSRPSWYFVDLSKLQVQLIVKHDQGLAAIRPINMYINHQEGDRLSAGAMDNIKDELIPQRLLPQEKVK